MADDKNEPQKNISSHFQNIGNKNPDEIAQLKARLRDTYSDDLSSHEEEKPKKPRRVLCITRAMAEDFSREQVLFSTLIETVFYIFFICTCSIHVHSLKSQDMFYMTEAIKQGLLNKDFEDEESESRMEAIKFADIATVADMWLFLSVVFIETIYFEKYYNTYSSVENDRALSVLYENVVLGVPRIRQVRVTNMSCEVHPYFQKQFKLCYGSFDSSSEDREPFGLEQSTAWVYTDATETENIDIMGKAAIYNGGGYYLDLDINGTKARDQIKDLEKNLWITRNSRAVFLHFTLYNANLNIFGICKIIFEIPPTGGVLPSHKFECIKLIIGYRSWEYFAFICETIFYIFIFFYIMQSVREFLYFKLRYFLRFWSYIDWIITGLAIAAFVLILRVKNHIEEAIRDIKGNPEDYGNLEYMAHSQILHDDISAIGLFFVFIRLFKYLNFNRTMGQLNDTLKKCVWDILGFSLMFFIIFFAFAELGFLLFGAEVEDFRTFGHSMFSLLRTILGDFDYGAIERANKFLAPVYFLSYIFLVFFVLLNMFLAIINDTYADVKTEIAIAPPELQMTGFLKKYFLKILRKCKCLKMKPRESKQDDHKATAKEIRTVLEKCGFSQLEIEMFFARFNINPVAVATEYDINRLAMDLETMTPATQKHATGEATKNMEDLMKQKQQLKDMETTMFQLATKIDELIKQLEILSKQNEAPRKESTDSYDF